MRTLKSPRLRSVFPVILITAITLSAKIVRSEPISPPLHLDPVQRTLWSNDNLGIRFTYPPVWRQAVVTQPSTKVVLTWRLKKSKALIATCYIEAIGPNGSSLAGAEPEQIHKNIDSISYSALKNLRTRAPNARLIEARAAMQDGHPVIFLIREGAIESIDRTIRMKVYSIATSWRGNEINFECGTSIYGPEYAATEGGPRLIAQVERAILHVLRTLQFDRTER